MNNTTELDLIFVGCGGTFFMGASLFKVLVRRYKPRNVIFVDPDRLKGSNQDRQWPHLLDKGCSKSHLAHAFFGVKSSFRVHETFSDFTTAIDSGICPLGDVLLVVNVDNDETRLEVRNWAKSRQGWAGMVVSGCETDYGQAYWGAWEKGEAIHDWQVLHLDVGRKEGTEHRCTPQTAEANAMTGVLVGLVLGDVWEAYREGDYSYLVREYYWNKSPLHTVRSWTVEVVRQGEGKWKV